MTGVRVVLDSNIYVSALTFPGGSGDAAIGALLDGRYTALISESILGEVLGVLGRKFSRDVDELARVALFLSELTEHVDPASRISVLDDEPDNRVLECAVSGRADMIVTGDRAMLSLGTFKDIEVVSLRAFLGRLQVEP
jgi:putative PIN family toxin of toxin-antitoxin system